MCSAPIIFIHYGPAHYLKWTLRCARKTNPDKRIILLGDSASRRFAGGGAEYFRFEEFSSGVKHATFREVFQVIQGERHRFTKHGGWTSGWNLSMHCVWNCMMELAWGLRVHSTSPPQRGNSLRSTAKKNRPQAQYESRLDSLSRPILFIHGGPARYLRWTLRCAWMTNPDKRVILPGDHTN